MGYPIFLLTFGPYWLGGKVGNPSQVCSEMSWRFLLLSFKCIIDCDAFCQELLVIDLRHEVYITWTCPKISQRPRESFSSAYLICSSLLDETQDTLWKFIETSVSCSLTGPSEFLSFFFFFKHTLAKVLSPSHLPDWISIISQAAITLRCLRFICLGIL